jgi:hypothetical protein
MLSTLLPAGTPLYMESPLGARISRITLDYGHWDEPLFTFPDSLAMKGRERIGEHHMLGYYRKYVSPSERFRIGNPKDHLFVLEGRFRGYSLSAVLCRAEEEASLEAEAEASASGSASCVAELSPCVVPPPPCVAEPPLCEAPHVDSDAPMSAVAAALERIRVREAELLAELEDLERVRAAQERLAALELRVAAARAVLNSV